MDYSKDANDKKRKGKKATTKKVKNRVGLIIMRIIFILIVLAFFAVLGAGMGTYFGIIGNAQDVNLLKVTPTNYTSYIVDQNGNEITAIDGEEKRDYIQISEIPKAMQEATIAIEDERFYKHNGVDLKSMIRAAFATIEGKLTGTSRVEGASTITQQLIKGYFFPEALTGNKEQRTSIVRKLQEQYMAVTLEKQTLEINNGNKKASKDKILELYLNTINYGGVHGVQAAAKRFFGKDASELTLAECASLAAAPNAPSKYNPNNKENNKKRQRLVLKNMKDQGYITESQYNQAINEDIYQIVENVDQEVKEENSKPYSYYDDQLIEEVSKDLQEQKGLSKQAADSIVLNQGIKIFSCQDKDIQAIVDEAYKNPNLFPKDDFGYEVTYFITVKEKNSDKQHHYSKTSKNYLYNQDEIDQFVEQTRAEYLTDDVELVLDRYESVIQPQSAFVITDYHTGEVKAVIGGRGDKLGSRTYNRATQAKRQPGSTFKVLTVYAPGIDTGVLTPATVFDDSPYKKGNWSPGNWYSGYRGPSTVRKGIEYSMNIVAARAIDKVGMDVAFDYLLKFGFTTLVDVGDRTDGKSDRNDATVLGGLTDGVILSELNSAYGTIANGGEYLKPIFYTKVVDQDGNILLENKMEPERVLEKTTAFLLTDMMKDVITGQDGTAKVAKFQNIKMPVAGKTGTTSDVKDLMFSAYTPYYVGSVWLGHDQNRNLKTNGQIHEVLWREIMEQVHIQKGLEYKDFERPDGIVTKDVCTLTGKLASSSCGSRVITEYFAAGTEPTERCNAHRINTVRIDTSTNKLANEYCPEEFVEVVQVGDDDADIPTEICDIHTIDTVSTSETDESTDDFDIDDFEQTTIYETLPTVPTISTDNNGNVIIEPTDEEVTTNSDLLDETQQETEIAPFVPEEEITTLPDIIPTIDDTPGRIDVPPSIDNFLPPEN